VIGEFLNSKKSDSSSKNKTEMSKLICENDDKSKEDDGKKSSSYLDDKNIIEK
jgi:hypothetical protein